MDGFLTRQVVEEVRQLLADPRLRKKLTDHNYEIAARYYSFSELRRCLRTLIINIGSLYPV
jgi:spore maturation protein CgeB